MSTVQTVSGRVEGGALGVVLPHEHLFADMYRVTRNPSHYLDDLDGAVEDLRHFGGLGGRTVVDLTSGGLGRDPARLAEAAKLADVQIVMGCGWYREPFYDPTLQRRSVRDLADELCAEIADGVDGVRPGVIGEIGADRDYVSGIEERVLRAAGRAATRTGLGLVTHAVKSRVGLDQLDLLAEEGVDLRRVAVSHCDSFMHADYHEAIARRGAYVSLDRHNARNPLTQRRRLDAVCRLVESGHADRILLSQDVCYAEDRREAGGPGYSYVLGEVLPALLARGIAPEALDGIVRDNPRRLLTGDAA